METTYHLKPNLTWHDGAPLSAEDFVFAWKVYSTPEFGVATSPPIGLMEEVVAPDARTLLIRWRQPYPDAAESNAHVGALQGPVERQTPNSSGTFLHVHRWEWRS
jgi:peptide/nickel transport system substrate-binding protein